MKHESGKNYYLNETEYAILLAGKGIKEAYTIQADTVSMQPEDICLAMNGLYQSRLVDCEEGTFHMEEDLDLQLNQIRDAKTVLFIRNGKDETQNMCLFSGERGVTVLQVSKVDGNSYRIGTVSSSQVLDILREKIRQPYFYQAVMEEEEFYRKILRSKKCAAAESIRIYHNLVFLIEQIEAESGDVMRRVAVRVTPDALKMDILAEKEEKKEKKENLPIDERLFFDVVLHMLKWEEKQT